MDGFSYSNIFETKGIEYLIIIAFLIMIIPFWVLINRQVSIAGKIKNAIGILSAGILRIPQGILFSKNHTWAHLSKSGLAEVGLDDFLMHIIGEVNFRNLKMPGSFIKKGELLADIDQDGKLLKIYSPVSGQVQDTNRLLYETPGIVNEDPYEKGWIYRLRPSEWTRETTSCFMAGEALTWSKMELDRFRDFLAASFNKYSPEVSLPVMQDGGEFYDNPLSGLPEPVWNDFQKSFLNSPD